MTGRRDRTVSERIADRVDTSAGPDACHPWTGGNTKGGYGSIAIGRRPVVVTRWLLGDARGLPLESHERALHRCDNPPCCNLAHLFVGTQKDNMADCRAKGRAHTGWVVQDECQKGHPLTPETVYVHAATGKRRCAECHRERQRAYEARRAS